MAYIDNNNDLAAGKGKDPISELDAELEKVLAELDEMNRSGSPAEIPPEQAPAIKNETADSASSPEASVSRTQQTPPPPEKKKRKAPIIILIVILAGLLAAGGYFLINGLLSAKLINNAQNSSSTETFTDSELGEVTVKKVDGAELNTYDVNNLVKNENGFYEYVVDGKVTSEVGIDLAEYQGSVDFEAVKNDGVDFVILRIGGRYYSEEGAIYEDESFDAYYEQAKNAGLKVGAYFFSQAASVEDAAQEAEFVVQKLDGRKLDYPIAFDWETIEDDAARTDGVDGKTITAMAEKFCDTVAGKGYRSIVYASTSLMLQSYDFETMKDYEFWLADYREFPNMYYDFAIWQYATDGEVDGVDGTVDLNICFKPY